MHCRKYVSLEANLIALKERIIVPILHVLLLLLIVERLSLVRPTHSIPCSVCINKNISPLYQHVAHISSSLIN